MVVSKRPLPPRRIGERRPSSRLLLLDFPPKRVSCVKMHMMRDGACNMNADLLAHVPLPLPWLVR